jgi:hypothetical protein
MAPWERRRQPARQGRSVGQNVQDATLGAYDMLTFGWGDEAAGLINEDWKWSLRDASRQAEKENPLFYYGGQVAGGFIPGAGALSLVNRVGKAAPLVGGAIRGANRVLASPGLGVGGRIASGALLGAGGGAVAGAGFADEGSRGMGAVQGAAFGAPLGAGASALAPVVGRMLAGKPKPRPGFADDVIEGAIPTGAGGAPPSGAAFDDFVRTMARGPRRTADAMEAYVEAAMADPGRGRTFMDAMGRAGVKKARQEFSKPGQAADELEAAFTERARGSRERIERQVSGVADGDPLAALNAQVDEIAKAELGPWFQRANPAAAQNVLTNLSRRPTVASALKQADQQIEEHVAAGMIPPEAAGNAAYRLHYARIVLQDGAKDPTRLASSIKTMSNANLVSASNAITDALDNVTPGYRAALDRLRARMQPRAMVKAARNAQRTDRSNVAGNMLSNPSVRQAISTGGMDDLGRGLRAEDELFRNSSRVLSGSDTASNLTELGSQMARSGPPSIAGAVNDAWRNTFGQVLNEAFGDAAEQRSNELVRMMLQRVDDPDPATRAQVKVFLTRLRDRLRQMEQNSQSAARGAVETGAGVGGGYYGGPQEF